MSLTIREGEHGKKKACRNVLRKDLVVTVIERQRKGEKPANNN